MDDPNAWNTDQGDTTADATTIAGNPIFDVVFESVSTGLFWVLLLGHTALGLYKRREGPGLKRWPLYIMLQVYASLSCIGESLGLAYTTTYLHGTSKTSTYLAYVFFWHASTAAFLMLLLALSSGYCITRGDLQGQEPKVIGIPTILFVAGVAADFTFVYVQTSQQLSAAGDRYAVVDMQGFEAAVWVVGSLANVMCFILAWVVIFDSTQLEIRALDEAQQALLGPAPDENGHVQGRPDSSDDETHQSPVQVGEGRSRRLGTTSQHAGLLYGMEESTARRAVSGSGVGEVHEEGRKATFADTMEYTIRKRLLMRFYIGVCTYLLASMMVILLPVLFNTVVQNTFILLEFIVKYLFTVGLAWTFRPGKDSPYLQIGLNDSDSAGDLDTELTMADFPSARENAPQGRPGMLTVSSSGPAPQLPISTPAGNDQNTVGRQNGGYGGRGNGQANGARPKFTLDEDE